jgi:glutathione S-transferase
MLCLYDNRYSGNAWKFRILLRQLGIPFERITLDLAQGGAKSPAFLAKSRFARVPVLEFEDGRTLVESAAIMLYLADGSPLLGADPYLRAEVTSWLFFEQADLLRALVLPRFYYLRGIADQMAAKFDDFQEFGYAGLARLAAHWKAGVGWSQSAIRSPISGGSPMSRWRPTAAMISVASRQSNPGSNA